MNECEIFNDENNLNLLVKLLYNKDGQISQ